MTNIRINRRILEEDAMRKISLLAFILLFNGIVYGEIQRVVLAWNPEICRNLCIGPLQRQLEGVAGISQMTLNGENGTADLLWKPNVPFSIAPLNTAARVIGLRLRDIRVRVRGTVQRSGNDYHLVSIGDNTSFLLLGHVPPATGTFFPRNFASHPLSAGNIAQLDEAISRDVVVTVEGPLFAFERFTLSLMVELLQLPKEKNPR